MITLRKERCCLRSSTVGGRGSFCPPGFTSGSQNGPCPNRGLHVWTPRRPSRLQSGDDVFQFLAEGGPDEAVPGVGQHHDQGPRRAAAARLRVLDQTQTAEVQRSATSPGAVSSIRTVLRLRPRQFAAADEPVQGRLGHLTPSVCQQLHECG